MTKEHSNGATAGYYQLPEGATQLQDLISHLNLNAQIGEIFRACYRYGRVSHSDELRDARKILFYAKAEVERLEKLQKAEPVKSSDEKPVLKVGQVWRNRRGEAIEIVRNNGSSCGHPNEYPFMQKGGSLTYMSSGRWCQEGEDVDDLIELICDVA